MPPKTKLMAAACLVTAIGVVAYWVLFFFVPGSVQSSNEACYLIFERSFPAADAWVTLCYCLAGVALLRSRKSSLLWGLLAASGLIYLGCMDVLYDLENGMYAHLTFDVGTEIFLNVFCFSFGTWSVVWFWRERDGLLAATSS